MVKNYVFLFLCFFLGCFTGCYGQEIKIFTIADFDLKGPVKSCLVSTKYGKEAYDFDKEGRLAKSMTQYNDSDYDVTYYKYDGDELIEKRLENYRDDEFDRSTSIANFYEIDTTGNRRVIEKIISYDEEFLDQYEYSYDQEGKLELIIRTNNSGTDETKVEYSSFKGEDTKTLYLNGMILESVRTSRKKAKDESMNRIELTKKFLNGEPYKATEAFFDADGKLMSRTIFSYNTKSKQFAPQEVVNYFYNDLGFISKEEIKSDDKVETKEYIYQFDDGDKGNWVKQIITPDNTYMTRKISYYKVPRETLESGEKQ